METIAIEDVVVFIAIAVVYLTVIVPAIGYVIGTIYAADLISVAEHVPGRETYRKCFVIGLIVSAVTGITIAMATLGFAALSTAIAWSVS